MEIARSLVKLIFGSTVVVGGLAFPPLLTGEVVWGTVLATTLASVAAGNTANAEEEWRDICRQRLMKQKQLTTNPFSNADGVTVQLDEIYVPLAIVERKPPKQPSRGQPEEKETERLIPIAEDRFFEDVLRQGKSEKSLGRKIAIIGKPGSGKTTRLQKIGDWILEEEWFYRTCGVKCVFGYNSE